MKKLIFPLFTFFVVSCFMACSGEEPVEEAAPQEFIILQMNDVYEIGPLENGAVGGLARVATIRKELMAENPNVIMVLSGDFVSPSLIGTLKVDDKKIAGAQMVDVLNELGLDYVTFGNHEFDIKENELEDRLNESKFQYVCANAFHQVDSANRTSFTQNGTAVPSRWVHPLINGTDTLNVGLTGVVLPFNEQDWVYYYDADSSFLAEVEMLKQESDVVVAITHLEMSHDEALAGKTDVPLFLGGHDHTAMNATVTGTDITKADANAKTIYIHRISVAADGSCTINSELKAMDSTVAFDPEIAAVVKKWTDLADKAMADLGYDPYEVIYTTDVPLDGRESSIRYHATNLGTMIADALRSTNPEADLAIMNSGSVRLDDQLNGDVTQYDVLRSLPFGGSLVYADIDGATLAQVLEIGTTTNVSLGGFLQLSGAEKSGDGWMINGEALDEGRTYKLVGPDFLMAGKEANLEMLGDLTGDTPEQTPNGVRNDIRDVVIGYMKSL